MLKNAFAYVTRKGLKSLVILLVILTMSALSLISLSIKEATDKASTKTFSNITNSFSIEINRRVNPGTPRGGGNVKGQDIKKIANSDQILDFYKKISKDFKKTEENGNYVLTYTGSGDQFKELMVAIANASSGNEVNAEAFNNVEFKNVSIKLVVTKDFIPVTNEVSMELATKNTSTPTTMKIKQNIKYSNVNNVKEIKLPDEVKNAKEVATDAQKQQ